MRLCTVSPYMSWHALWIIAAFVQILAKMSSGLDEGNYYVGEPPTTTCSSRGINVLAVLNSGQRLSPSALRSASIPAVDITPM